MIQVKISGKLVYEWTCPSCGEKRSSMYEFSGQDKGIETLICLACNTAISRHDKHDIWGDHEEWELVEGQQGRRRSYED
ncbi:MAG: hypothetical protein HQL08_04375 [Nitrospirae bacterium]|nr:hypothetical protein [Nitrospirota bacterium]